MKIYLIRHGRQCSKLCNVNVELSKEGYLQGQLLGQRLAEKQIDVVYSSHLIRGVQTAQAANAYWKAEHRIRPELREISFGDMEGLSDDVIAQRFAGFKIQQDEMKEDLAYPGGECASDVVARALPVCMEIAESGYKQAAVITHGGVIRSLVARLLHMDLAQVRLLGGSLENCSITELVFYPEHKRFTLERFNDYAHLETTPKLLRGSWSDAEN